MGGPEPGLAHRCRRFCILRLHNFSRQDRDTALSEACAGKRAALPDVFGARAGWHLRPQRFSTQLWELERSLHSGPPPKNDFLVRVGGGLSQIIILASPYQIGSRTNRETQTEIHYACAAPALTWTITWRWWRFQATGLGLDRSPCISAPPSEKSVPASRLREMIDNRGFTTRSANPHRVRTHGDVGVTQGLSL